MKGEKVVMVIKEECDSLLLSVMHFHKSIAGCLFSDIESASDFTTKMQSADTLNNPHVNQTSTAIGNGEDGGTGDAYSESEAVHALICRIQQAEGERDIVKEELSRALEQIEKLK